MVTDIVIENKNYDIYFYNIIRMYSESNTVMWNILTSINKTV